MNHDSVSGGLKDNAFNTGDQRIRNPLSELQTQVPGPNLS